MLTIISAIIVFLGSLNWFLIGVLQYDFVAGLFGFQASLFSRLIYFIIGMSAFYLLFSLIKNREIFKIYKKEKNKKENIKNDTQKEEKENPTSEKKWNFDDFNDFDEQNEYESHHKKYKDFDASKYD